MAELMSQVLISKKISHQVVLGKSDEGSAHTWIRISNKNYDPTKQGYGNGRYSVVEVHTFT